MHGSEASTGTSRGYVTTPEELRAVAEKARRGLEPYKDAVLLLESFANTGSSALKKSTRNQNFWPFGSIAGDQSCSKHEKTPQPLYLTQGSALVEAKAMAYQLEGDAAYADDARARLLELTKSHNYNGEVYGGRNQCILNLAWSIPGWIIAADLLENYPGWTKSDKKQFQQWLATEVYKKVEWASDTRSNNWGSAASATAGMIADYVAGSGLSLENWHGRTVSPHDAYVTAKKRQLDRMDGNSYMDHSGCLSKNRQQGIRADGGIPWELGRGPTGCDGLWILPPSDLSNPSYFYPQTYLAGTTLHAEFLLRRGDRSIYDNMARDGSGSLLKGVLFLSHNPNDPDKSVHWWLNSNAPQLEVLYRYYRDPYIGQELGINSSKRFIAGRGSSRMLHFGTITHGFSPEENPGMPPVSSPP